MKMSDINLELTNIVKSYIDCGWTIYPLSMTGSQGEICKVDLVKGETLIRVWLSRELSSASALDCYAWHGQNLVLRVGGWKYPASKIKDPLDTAWTWSSEFSILDERRYYEIERNEWYIDDMDDAINIQAIRGCRPRDRISNDDFREIKNFKSKKIMVEYLKRVSKYQRISVNDIILCKFFSYTREKETGVTKVSVEYRVLYRCTWYTLK